MLYGCESWAATQVELNRLAVAQRRMERRLAGTTLRDRRTNEWLRGVTKVVDVVDEAQKRKWSYAWMGRMGQERWLSALLLCDRERQDEWAGQEREDELSKKCGTKNWTRIANENLLTDWLLLRHRIAYYKI